MPEIIKHYEIQKPIDLEDLYSDTKDCLTNVGGEKLEEQANSPTAKSTEAFISSIWGWGGMKISTTLEDKGDHITLTLTGYIAQLATGPLTKNMDKFLAEFSAKLQEKYDYNFEYEKTSKFITGFSLTKTDNLAFVAIIVITFITTLIGAFLGKVAEAFVGLLFVGGAYYFGKKYLYKNKS